MIADDRGLVRRSQQGDLDAFRELMARHRRMVFTIARAVVLCSDEAEDVTQEVFLHAHRAIGQCDSRRAFSAWVRAITVNCAVSALRRKARRSRGYGEFLAYGVRAAQAPPSREIERDELQVRVREAIQALPVKQRLAISLFSLEGMDIASAAAALGCSVGTLKSHLFRAREKLAKTLAGYVEEAEP